jgi:ACS family D-galactonate transporter-like MFS transporter
VIYPCKHALLFIDRTLLSNTLDSVIPAFIPRLRWRIGGLIGAGVLINYFDRISLSVAAPQLQEAFALTPSDIGLLLSAFFWSYALLQIPAGLLLDRFGVGIIGRSSTFLWTAASLVTACAGGFAGIFLARLLLGIAEAPSFLMNSKATGYWFPRSERARSTALFDAAAKFSNVIGVPLIALAAVHLGWRWGFGLVALLSAAYFGAFWSIYRDPSRHSRLSSTERDYILANGAAPEGALPAGPAGMLGYLLRRRKVWGLTIGFAAYGYCFYLFLTWLPAYLMQTMHMSILRSAGLAAIPWCCATLSDLLVGGWLIDRLIAGGRSDTRVRKTVLLTGMCAGLAVMGAATTRDPVVAITWISVALSGLAAAAPVCWSLPSLIAPKGGVGTVGGIMNFGNNMMGAAAPMVTGYVVGSTQSFANAFIVAGFVLLVGVASFAFLLGRIEPLAGPATST